MELIYLISLGCPKNLVDSEIMLGILADAGYIVTSSLKEAEIIIINTCGFIRPAVEESLNTIFECIKHKQKGKCRYLIVTGCMTQRYGHQLTKQIPEVDAWLGVHSVSHILECIKDISQGQKIVKLLPSSKENYSSTLKLPRLLTTPPATAYLKIAEGCSNFCSYCLIPYIRGELRSRNLEDIYQEAVCLADNGIKEIVLVAQDSGSYGKDLWGKPSLDLVLKRLARISEIEWIRILYVNPSSITPKLIETIKNESKVCHYLDIPFQHANRDILRKMGRNGDICTHLELLDKIRSYLKDITLRTTLMVGFPGEDEKTYQDLIDFIKLAQFDRLGIFPYYHEEGTKAFRYPDTVSYIEKKRRSRHLLQIQREISRKKNKALEGAKYTVMIEKHLADDIYIGRSYREAPEIDPKIIVKGKGLTPGTFCHVKITHAYAFDLAGSTI